VEAAVMPAVHIMRAVLIVGPPAFKATAEGYQQQKQGNQSEYIIVHKREV